MLKIKTMKLKNTVGNTVMVLLDPDNDHIELKSGGKLHLDTSFEPEKHIVRIGTVKSVPKSLVYVREGGDTPWKTKMELEVGDKVVMYFLAVQNCLIPEKRAFIKNEEGTTIFIQYKNIYATIRNGNIIPVNGYVLVEPIEDPEWERKVNKAKELGLELVDNRKPSNTNVCYGRIAYMGEKNEEYFDLEKSDEGYSAKVGDVIVMKKIRDIPIEYEYHTKMGRKLYRVQRPDILAVL